MTLNDLKQGESGTIVKVVGRGTFRKRLMELGFVKGTRVTAVRAAPLRDPVEFSLLNYQISLRRSEAEHIYILPNPDANPDALSSPEIHTTESEWISSDYKKIAQHIDVALVGNPNAGKTSLFNAASGSSEHVGNYSGVTVEASSSLFHAHDYEFHITDLPGTYSISAYSPEELYVRQHILEKHPDVIINVVDATNLERNLFLTTQLIDMDYKVIIALNMYDELEKTEAHLDYITLGKLLGIPIVPTIASKNEGIDELFKKAIAVYEDQDKTVRHIHINYGNDVEESITKIQNELRKNEDFFEHISSRYYSIKLLEKDSEVAAEVRNFPNGKNILLLANNEIAKLEGWSRELSETLIANQAYSFIKGALKETFKLKPGRSKQQSRNDKIDAILTHKIWGFPIFLAFLWIMFQSTFVIGQIPMDWIDSGVQLLRAFLQEHLHEGIVKSMLIDGIVSGVGGVIVFLPNILILFGFISLMEDSGYMARVAFIMDKLMHTIGLHGKSFIPLIMGFGCNVPAIMATRTIENKRDRLLTMLIIPFMSCSARLPVYILLAGAFFSKIAGTLIFGIYLFGILISILTALLLKSTLFKGDNSEFVMELPPYRLPGLRATTHHIGVKAGQYLKKMGGIILVASLIIWVLGYFPRTPEATPAQQLEQSYIGKIGKGIEPIIRPLGFDWRMGVSIVAGTSAKEIVVSTLSLMYSEEGTVDGDHSLVQRFQNDPNLSPLKGLSFMLFILLYFPCVAVFAAVRRESGHWYYALFMAAYTTAIAWLVAFAVFQIGSLFIT